MKLRYQTATATLIQFVTLTLLGIPNNLISIISTCHSDSTNCVSNSIVTLIYFLLTAGWFAIIMVLGYLAQNRRSRRFAFILIGCEFITLFVAGIINFSRDPNLLAKGTSLLDALLSVWIIYLASRLLLAGNKRIVKKSIVPKKN